MRHIRRHRHYRHIKAVVTLGVSAVLICIGFFSLWVATLQTPDIGSFGSRQVIESTKIYDRTGTILLFDTGANAKRTVIPLSDMSLYIPMAAVAIEDSRFYTNIGIEPLSFIRAILVNLISRGYDQGGSTITQQVVKNSLLTRDKTVSRKVKEWVLAVKLTRTMTKDQILNAYLNETSYGGTVFGVEEASQEFFGHPAKDVTLAEAAYLAAIPQAPTYYSPYGTHTEELARRQRVVLQRMKELKVITETEYQSALMEKVSFLSRNSSGLRAPHFVMFVREYLVSKYGEEAVLSGGLRVITTLDYDMQQKAEAVIDKFSPTLSVDFNASNQAMVALDPKTGDVLAMIGSKDYFDSTIDGNYNVALARRQPGSTFKPFVYASAFAKGYTPETILWDIKTEFSTACNPDSSPKDPALAAKIAAEDPSVSGTTTSPCYSPGEYDDIFEGPITMRQALARSRNVPAVQALYLAGITNSLRTAEGMGINISNPDRCGLSLVLGGCEVSLLDITSAYGVFANDGVRNPSRSVLEVDDGNGSVLERASLNQTTALSPDSARQISDILSDTSVRMSSLRQIGESVGRPVAIKTGTTNDYRDVWTVGYTPGLVVGFWAGNNDNEPMQKNVAGLIISPLWGAFMSQVAKNFPPEPFGPAVAPTTDNKPVLRGVWQGGVSYWIDSVSGKVATQYTPLETKKEVVFNDVHSILQWVDKDDPRGPVPADPTKDSQYPYWEYAVQEWLKTWRMAHPEFQDSVDKVIPSTYDDVHVPAKFPKVSFLSPTINTPVSPDSLLRVELRSNSTYPPQKTDVYMNGRYVMTARNNPLSFSFVPSDTGNVGTSNSLSITLYDSVFNKTQATTTFSIVQ